MASLPSATTTRTWLFYTKIKLFSVPQLSFAPFIHADYHKRCRMRFVAVSCRSIALRNLIQKKIPQGIGSGATQKVFPFTLPDWKNPGRLVEGCVRIAYALRKEYLFSIFHFMLNHPHAMIFKTMFFNICFGYRAEVFQIPRTFSRRQSQPTLPQYITIHNP